MKPKFINLFCSRTGTEYWINIAFITNICSANTVWEKGISNSKVEFVGDAGYHTKAIFCASTPGDIIKQIGAMK